MEEIKLIINEERFIKTNNPFGEISLEYICKNEYIFQKGKIYGIVCEYGGGGEIISLLLSNKISLDREKIYIDNMEASSKDIDKLGWYVGKKISSHGLIRREQSVRQALEDAIKNHHRYEHIEDIIEEFHLMPDKLHYGLSRNCEWEMWRASIAIGYSNNKKIYCFPWMNTLCFYDCMYNSSVFRFFNKLKKEGSIIILPTSREKNVKGFVDEIIQIHNPRFEHVISDSEYFQKYF